MRGLERLHAKLLRRAFQTNRAGGLFALQQEPALFFNQLIALAAQAFSVVAVSERREVLAPGIDETAGEPETANQQEAKPQEGVTITFADDGCISLFRGKASNHFGLQQTGQAT